MGASTPPPNHDEDEITQHLNFLARIPLYDTVKPYAFRSAPIDGFPATNVENDAVQVILRNMRVYDVKYSTHGFCFHTLPTAMTYDDYDDPTRIEEVHIPEVETFLKGFLKANYVQILNYGQRRRHATFPISTGKPYEHQQPANRAHIDVTYAICNSSIRNFLGPKADEVMTGRWQYVNVWHPLSGPLYDWPLALCDITTMNPEYAVPIDVLNATGEGDVDEEVAVQYSPEQKWYYLPGQMPTELLIFKSMESQTEEGKSFGTPHTAFDLKLAQRSAAPRESIEMRALVCW